MPGRGQMHDCRSARERPKKTHHEINSVVCGQNAEIAYARPERIQRCERDALLQIIFVRHHAAFRTSASSGRVDDAGIARAFTRDENRFASPAKFLPAFCAGKIGVCRSFSNQYGLHVRRGGAAGRDAELPPNRIFRDENSSARMLEQLPLFVRRQFVIEWNQNATGKKNRVSGNQPLRLIGHDDAGASASGETAILQSLGQRMRALLEVAIGQALFFALAVGLDQTHFVRILIQRIPQRFTDGLILGKVQHYRRD